MKNESKVFTSGEVASICGVSADTVSRWFDLGKIKGYRLGTGGDRRIPYASLRRFMTTHGIPLDRLDNNEQRILVVDDDPYYLDVIPALLSNTGEYTISVASNGYDAGALVVETNPHVVILDIQLTDMDGRMVCERIKSRPETQTSRVLAISGFIDDAKVENLKEHRFDAYLKKPFNDEELKESVSSLFETTP